MNAGFADGCWPLPYPPVASGSVCRFALARLCCGAARRDARPRRCQASARRPSRGHRTASTALPAAHRSTDLRPCAPRRYLKLSLHDPASAAHTYVVNLSAAGSFGQLCALLHAGHHEHTSSTYAVRYAVLNVLATPEIMVTLPLGLLPTGTATCRAGTHSTSNR